VIEEEQICRWSEVCQSARDRALSLRVMVRIGEMELTSLKELWRTRRQLERTNARAFNGKWKEDVRVAERVMVKEVRRSSMEVAGVDVPTLDRKRRAELIFLVSLAAQRN